MMPLHRALTAFALLAVGLAQWPAAPALAQGASIDPFYTDQLEEGIRALAESDARSAVRSLRVACFGLLDQPEVLGRGLAYLGVAQGRVEDKDGFVETWRRLVTVEQRFQGFSRATLATAVRSELEAFLVRFIPEEQLASVPAFSGLAGRRRVARLERLPARERRSELEALISAQPKEPAYRLGLAALELEDGKPAEALRHAAAALELDPASNEALCLRGLASAGQGHASCAAAVADLERCAEKGREPALAAALLSCRIVLSQRAEAESFLASLPLDLRTDKEVARLAKQLERQAPARSSPAPAEPGVPLAAEPPKPQPAPAGPVKVVAAPALTPAEVETLSRVRENLKTIRQAGDLALPLSQVAAVAQAHPEHTETQLLAAEIAYRASRWNEAAQFFRQAGIGSTQKPDLLFYMAVSFYESGDREAAAAALERCLPRLQRTPFVEEYRRKIQGAEGTSP
ncbi:MAG TPA: hypothetical protein VF017_22675 [Thermoanaerobaculia bacterium]|nr:hypothetical protein [Thermoanaerobaculia bacterium]